MSLLTTLSVNPDSNAFVSNVNKQFLMPFEPTLRYAKYAVPSMSQNGYSSVTWLLPARSNVTPDQALVVQPGVTPQSTDMTITTIKTEAKQYIIYSTLTDQLDLISQGYEIANMVGTLLGENMARIIDRVTQDEVLDNATYRTFAATTPGGTPAANRAALTPAHNMFFYDFNRIRAKLEGERYASTYDGQNYLMICHTKIAEALKAQALTAGQQSFFELTKYSQPDKIEKGEIGMINGIRLLTTAYAKIVSNGTYDVYQTVVFGKGAYGGAQLAGMQNIVHAFGSAGTADPANQRMTIASKVYFAAKILRQDAIEVFESCVPAGL